MSTQPILPVTVNVKMIKGVAHQRNVVTLDVNMPLDFNVWSFPILVLKSDEII